MGKTMSCMYGAFDRYSEEEAFKGYDGIGTGGISAGADCIIRKGMV